MKYFLLLVGAISLGLYLEGGSGAWPFLFVFGFFATLWILVMVFPKFFERWF